MISYKLRDYKEEVETRAQDCTHGDSISAASGQFTACERNQKRSEPSPPPPPPSQTFIRLPFTYFYRSADARGRRFSESNEFVIRQESRLFLLGGFTDGSSLLVRRSGGPRWTNGEGAWKPPPPPPPPRPSLADRWKIHKLFQEKRRKSISNYSFL